MKYGLEVLRAACCILVLMTVTVTALSNEKPPAGVNNRRSILLSSAGLVAVAPFVAMADGGSPAPAPKPAPAPAPPPDPIKVQAESEAKKKIAEEIAKEEAKLKAKAWDIRRTEDSAKQRVEKLSKDIKAIEARLKALGEARSTAEKLEQKLRDTGSQEGSSVVKQFKNKEQNEKSKLTRAKKDMKSAEEKLKLIKGRRLEVEARYKIKTGKELVLPPSTARKPRARGGGLEEGTESLFKVGGGFLALATFLSVVNSRKDGGGFGDYGSSYRDFGGYYDRYDRDDDYYY